MHEHANVKSRPEFIDNQSGNTLAQALNTVLSPAVPEGAGGQVGAPPDAVRIATAFFNPSGFAEIATRLQRVREVRLMLGADLAAATQTDRRRLDESDAMFERRRLQVGLQRMVGTLRWERDRMPFTRTSGRALRLLIETLRAGNMQVRRYEKAFLHAKAYVLTRKAGACEEGDGIFVGSSNLTKAGLTRNLELNLGLYERPVVERAQLWFDELWDDAEPYDLSEVFEEAFLPRTPWEVFLRVLWQLYGDEVEQDSAVDDNLPLTSFQKHGVARALRLIRDTGGAIVADEVGLGKTFIAGEILQTYRERRQRALLICPAALRDTTWRKFLTRFELFVECLSFEELANDIQLQRRASARCEPGKAAASTQRVPVGCCGRSAQLPQSRRADPGSRIATAAIRSPPRSPTVDRDPGQQFPVGPLSSDAFFRAPGRALRGSGDPFHSQALRAGDAGRSCKSQS